MKKLTAILLTLIFVLQFSMVYASTEDNSWEISYNGSFTDIAPREQYIAEINEDNAYEGLRSLYMNCWSPSKDEANYIEIKNKLKSPLQVGEYILTLYVKQGPYGMYSGVFDVSLGGETISVDAGTGTTIAAPSGQSGWIEKTLTFNYDGTGEENLSFKVYCNVFDVCIDNITLAVAGSGENLVSDPSFEDYAFVTAPESDTTVPYNRAPYLPKNVLCTSGANLMGFTWINPSSATLQKISLYDVTSGEAVLVKDDFSITPSAYINYKQTDLQIGGEYFYKLVFSFSDKGKDSYYLSASTSPRGNWSYNNLSFVLDYASSMVGYCPGVIMIDKTVGHDSNASVKFVSNIDRGVAEMNGNLTLRLSTSIAAMEEGKTYEISVWTKTEKVYGSKVGTQYAGRGIVVSMGGAQLEGYGWTIPNTTSGTNGGTNDWSKATYIYEYKAGKSKEFRLHTDGVAEGFWIDQIECYEVVEETDSDGEDTGNYTRVTGENICENGDFEGEELTASTAVSSLTATPSLNEAVISWTKPADYQGAYLYKKVFDTYEYRGFLSNTTTSVKIDGLETDTEYSYKIVPTNTYNALGEASEITFRTKLEDYSVTEPYIKKNGAAATAISGAGTYTVAATVKNNTAQNGLPCEIIAAVFNGKELLGVYSSDKIISQTDKNISPANIYTTCTIPNDGGDYSVEVYLVNKRDSMDVYCLPSTF